MKKKILPALLLSLLLCSCGSYPEETVTNTDSESRQEENMRTVLAQKKQRRNEELLDTVLQEIFD